MIELEPKSPTAVMMNSILLDTIQLRDVYNHKVRASHSPLQYLIKVEHIVERMFNKPAKAMEWLDELQYQLMLVNNSGIYIPNEFFCGGTKKFFVGRYHKEAPAAGKRFITYMPSAYISPSQPIECK